MSGYAILSIDKNSIQKLDKYIPEISKLRRNIWIKTYVNNDLGITENKVIENFREFNEEVEKYKEYIYKIKNFSYFFIALDNNKLIGFSIAKKRFYKKSIDTLFIDDQYQGNGLGSKLMDKMIKKLNSPKIYVDVISYNKKAINFYRKYGFSYLNKHRPIVLDRITPWIFVPQIRMRRNA